MSDEEIAELYVAVLGDRRYALDDSFDARLNPLTDSEKSFVKTHGLPAQPALMMDFDFEKYGFRMLNDVLLMAPEPHVQGDSRPVVCGCMYAIICLNARMRTVHEVNVLGLVEDRYVNASLIKYLGSIASLLQYHEAPADADHDALVSSLAATLRSVDPTSVEDANSYWNLVIDQAQSDEL
jgi:hypothetical protein